LADTPVGITAFPRHPYSRQGTPSSFLSYTPGRLGPRGAGAISP